MAPLESTANPTTGLSETPGIAAVQTPDLLWIVVHTKPRCEKKFAELLRRETIHHELPLVTSVRRYQNQTKRFTKPLFPGYVFVQMDLERKNRLFQQDLVVRILSVHDQTTFCLQLDTIRTLLRSGLALQTTPLRKGARVRIVGGPLHGVEGVVDDPDNPRGVIVAVDVLQQGVLVRLPPESIERLN